MISNKDIELKNIAWDAAQVVKGYNPDHTRLDACGAWIKYEDFNNTSSMFGWEIDHICPIFRLKQLNVSNVLWDNPLNIRAMHWRNKQSKGTSYPTYTSEVVGSGDINMEQRAEFLVSDLLQDSLNDLFKIKINNY